MKARTRNEALKSAVHDLAGVGLLSKAEWSLCLKDERDWRRVPSNQDAALRAERFTIPADVSCAARVLALVAAFVSGEDYAWAVDGSVFALMAARIARRVGRSQYYKDAVFRACLKSYPWIRDEKRDVWDDVTDHGKKDEKASK